MFGRKRRELELTSEAYSKWLRAQRPDMDVFLGLSEMEQEALALLGDEYVQDLAVAIGYAVKNPQATEAGLDAATNPESEEQLLKQVMQGAVSRILTGSRNGASEAPAADPKLSLAGLSERRRAAEEGRQDEKDEARSFLGRKPDAKDPIRGC